MKKIICFFMMITFVLYIFADLDKEVSREYYGYNVANALNDEYSFEDASRIMKNEDELTRRSFASLISIYLNHIEKMYKIDGYVPVRLELLVGIEKMILDFTDEIEMLFSDNISSLSKKITLLETIIAQKSKMMGVLKPHVDYKNVNKVPENEKINTKDDVKKDIHKIVRNLELKGAEQKIEKNKIDKKEYHPDFYKKVSINAVNSDLRFILDAMIENTSLNLFVSDTIRKTVTAQIKDMHLIDGLKKIADKTDCIVMIKENNIDFESKNKIEERVFRLKHIESDKAVDFLNKLKSSEGKIITNPITNSVIVYDTIENLKKIESNLIDIDQRDSAATFQTRVVALNYAEAQDVIGVLNTLKSSDGNIATNVKSNSLIIMDKKGNVEKMEDLIRKLDIPSFESRKTTMIYNVKYGTASDIMTVLQSEAFTGSMGDDIKLSSDTRTNSIVMTGAKETINKMLQYVQQLDIRTKQVTIAAKIIEVKLDDENSNGVNFNMLIPNGAKEKSVDQENKISINTMPDTLGNSATGIKYGTLEKEQLEILYQKLTTKTNGKVISNPTITTLDNQEAKILIGEKIPFEETTTSEGNTSSTINFKDVGITLTVVPKISPDNYITLKVHPEISSSTKTTSSGEPIIETTEADTNVIIKNGETLVIGGLIKNNKRKTVNRVPILGNIGFLRKVFRYEKNTTERTETIVLITPNIIEDYKRNNNVYLKKYKNISTLEVENE